jgi:predicted  nucleic acid-binding Zn-ribbon protein
MKKVSLLGVVLLSTALSFTSCNNKLKAELETVNTELMKGHDDVMPKTMQIASVKKDLLAAAETSNDSLKNQALEISTSLQKAEDDMYLWMDNFGKAMNDVKNEEEKLKLYKELNTEIKNITTLTDESIAKAKAYVATNSTVK